MPKTRPPYAAEFRQQMVDLVRSVRAPEDLAREFEPSSQAIRTWVAQAGRDAGERSDGLRSEEREELRRLRREQPAPARRARDIGKGNGLVRAGGPTREIYRVMSANQARVRVATMARVLGVSPSGYYAWRRRPPSALARADAELRARVQAIHGRSRGDRYGAPRMHADLTAAGVAVSRTRVARVMRSAGVAGVSRRRGPRTTRRNAQAARHRIGSSGASMRMRRTGSGSPTSPTSRPEAGFLYLAIVLDVFSRRVVGWAMAGHLRTALVVEALEMAVAQRRPRALFRQEVADNAPVLRSGRTLLAWMVVVEPQRQGAGPDRVHASRSDVWGGIRSVMAHGRTPARLSARLAAPTPVTDRPVVAFLPPSIAR